MKVMYGGPVANASGSLAGVVASHNRGGSYFRRRTVPVTSTSPEATNAKARMAAASSNWKTLTDAQRDAWETYARTFPVVDTLGEKRVLTGQQIYNKLNTRILFIGGTQILVPPVESAPNALTSVTLTADIGAGNFELAFTPTPAPAGHSVWINAAVVDSAGINFVKNRYKLVLVSAAAAASPIALDTAIEARFGTLIVGQKVFVAASIMERATGLVSQPALSSAVVVST